MTGPEQMPKRQPTVSGSGHDPTETCRACGGLGEVYKQRPWRQHAVEVEQRIRGTVTTDAEIVQTAPEIVMDARGNFWRRHPDGSLSIPPTSTDNDPTAYPLVCYQPVDVERQAFGHAPQPAHKGESEATR